MHLLQGRALNMVLRCPLQYHNMPPHNITLSRALHPLLLLRLAAGFPLMGVCSLLSTWGFSNEG